MYGNTGLRCYRKEREGNSWGRVVENEANEDGDGEDLRELGSAVPHAIVAEFGEDLRDTGSSSVVLGTQLYPRAVVVPFVRIDQYIQPQETHRSANDVEFEPRCADVSVRSH